MAGQTDLLEEDLRQPHAFVVVDLAACVAESARHVCVEGVAPALMVQQLHVVSPALVAKLAVYLQEIVAPVLGVRYAHIVTLIDLYILMHTLGQLVGMEWAQGKASPSPRAMGVRPLTHETPPTPP